MLLPLLLRTCRRDFAKIIMIAFRFIEDFFDLKTVNILRWIYYVVFPWCGFWVYFSKKVQFILNSMPILIQSLQWLKRQVIWY